jgi:DnaJ-class molecular chaperone
VSPSSCILARLCSRCSKFLGNSDATHAFQKVAVAYDVLSKPSLKRTYDARSSDPTYNVFASHPSIHADETFKGVVIGVFNDFLDGDLEVIKTLLSVYQHKTN